MMKRAGLFLIFCVCFYGCSFQQVVKKQYHFVTHMTKGEYYLETKQYARGLAYFKLEMERSSSAPENHYYIGRFHLAKNNVKRGLKHLKRAALWKPYNADYHFWLGVAYAANKQYRLERKHYQRALALEKNHLPALVYLGHNQFDRGELKAALGSYTRALKRAPDTPEALYNRAAVLKKLGRQPEEIVALKAYLDVYPSGRLARKAVDRLNTLGDFEYRNHLIGRRTVTLKKIRFEPFIAKIHQASRPSLNLVGEIMTNNRKVRLHIVAYQQKNRKLAQARARSVKKYLVKKYPKIAKYRLKVSWFGVPKNAVNGRKVHVMGQAVDFVTAHS